MKLKPLSEKVEKCEVDEGGSENNYDWVYWEDVKEAVEKLTPELFHDTYEEVADRVGWETNRKCRVKFDDLPQLNQETMITTIRLIKNKIFGELK